MRANSLKNHARHQKAQMAVNHAYPLVGVVVQERTSGLLHDVDFAYVLSFGLTGCQVWPAIHTVGKEVTPFTKPQVQHVCLSSQHTMIYLGSPFRHFAQSSAPQTDALDLKFSRRNLVTFLTCWWRLVGRTFAEISTHVHAIADRFPATEFCSRTAPFS